MRDVRVLVVDDQAPFRQAMTAVVAETDGFEVIGAAPTGEEAVEAAARLLPDLVLMDVNLPGIDGAEASRRIRAQDRPPVVLLLSTHDPETGDALAAECGAAAYVPKAELSPDRLADEWRRARS